MHPRCTSGNDASKSGAQAAVQRRKNRFGRHKLPDDVGLEPFQVTIFDAHPLSFFKNPTGTVCIIPILEQYCSQPLNVHRFPKLSSRFIAGCRPVCRGSSLRPAKCDADRVTHRSFVLCSFCCRVCCEASVCGAPVCSLLVSILMIE